VRLRLCTCLAPRNKSGFENECVEDFDKIGLMHENITNMHRSKNKQLYINTGDLMNNGTALFIRLKDSELRESNRCSIIPFKCSIVIQVLQGNPKRGPQAVQKCLNIK